MNGSFSKINFHTKNMCRNYVVARCVQAHEKLYSVDGGTSELNIPEINENTGGTQGTSLVNSNSDNTPHIADDLHRKSIEASMKYYNMMLARRQQRQQLPINSALQNDSASDTSNQGLKPLEPVADINKSTEPDSLQKEFQGLELLMNTRVDAIDAKRVEEQLDIVREVCKVFLGSKRCDLPSQDATTDNIGDEASTLKGVPSGEKESPVAIPDSDIPATIDMHPAVTVVPVDVCSPDWWDCGKFNEHKIQLIVPVSIEPADSAIVRPTVADIVKCPPDRRVPLDRILEQAMLYTSCSRKLRILTPLACARKRHDGVHSIINEPEASKTPNVNEDGEQVVVSPSAVAKYDLERQLEEVVTKAGMADSTIISAVRSGFTADVTRWKLAPGEAVPLVVHFESRDEGRYELKATFAVASGSLYVGDPPSFRSVRCLFSGICSRPTICQDPRVLLRDSPCRFLGIPKPPANDTISPSSGSLLQNVSASAAAVVRSAMAMLSKRRKNRPEMPTVGVGARDKNPIVVASQTARKPHVVHLTCKEVSRLSTLGSADKYLIHHNGRNSP
eukprot:GHVT01104872.1.p1 GENE.GHVT01104872.1~~GHVT01104872.1.p1  ORF type:complete len:561 (-),score=31.14 GHVT01104872.1:2699-4381(-)